MQFDPQPHLAAVERAVSSSDRDGHPVRSVILSRAYAATIDDLWDAVTSAERIPRWFLPISGDLEVGGRFQLEGDAGGVIESCVRQSRYAVTWEFGQQLSWVDVRVEAREIGRSRLELMHTAPLSDQWDQYGPGATGVGWDTGLLGLALHLADPAAPKPDVTAFLTSPDGREFIVGKQHSVGRSVDRGRYEPRGCPCSGQPHDRVLHRRLILPPHPPRLLHLRSQLVEHG